MAERTQDKWLLIDIDTCQISHLLFNGVSVKLFGQQGNVLSVSINIIQSYLERFGLIRHTILVVLNDSNTEELF